MSAETLTRIMEQTDAKLAVASYGEETLAVGIEHMAALGRDLAESLFARVASERFSDAQINSAIIEFLDGLLQSITETFESFGITEGLYLDQCLEAAFVGYLDRGEELFTAPQVGGRA